MIFPAVEGILTWRRMTAPGGKLQFVIMKDAGGGVAALHPGGSAPSWWEHAILNLAAGPQALIIVDIGSPSPEAERAKEVIIAVQLFNVYCIVSVYVSLLIVNTALPK